MTLEAIKFKDGTLQVLDQLRLPANTEYLDVKDTKDGWTVIKKMQVRGAPAIAIVGCLSLVMELYDTYCNTCEELAAFIQNKLAYLVTARPTAVNMGNSAIYFTKKAQQLAGEDGMTVKKLKKTIVSEMEDMLAKDIADNKAVGQFGAEDIIQRNPEACVRILTHCNTGSLASAGYGTALGVIRSLHERGVLDHAYCTETRPYNQGARLTAYELVYEKIPATLICDSMAAMLMQRKHISAVVVGADRVVANGDTANKIGTYQLAIVAKYHGVPFYVACPTTAYDPSIANGEEIKIEERAASEMTSINGVQIAAPGIGCWNPAFDVTPADLITGGIITEYGLYKPSELQNKLQFLNGTPKS